MGGPPPQCSSPHDPDGHDQNKGFQTGIGIGNYNSTIRFSHFTGDTDFEVEMSSMTLVASWQINDKWSIRAGVGVIRGGELESEDNVEFEVEPGHLMAIGAEYRANVGQGYTPFVDLSMMLGGSLTEITAPVTDARTDYAALDFRLGARCGWNVSEILFPYVATRVFAGPIDWEPVNEKGSDIHHYQVALGAAIQFGRLGIFGEWAGLGEQALNTGLSLSW